MRLKRVGTEGIHPLFKSIPAHMQQEHFVENYHGASRTSYIPIFSWNYFYLRSRPFIRPHKKYESKWKEKLY